jgi:hypothetical protein
MSLARTLKKNEIKKGKYLCIDSSSKSVAFSIFNVADKPKLLAVGKFYLSDGMNMKMKEIKNAIEAIFIIHSDIKHVVIEQTIYIQSPRTSRILSYVVGGIWASCSRFCDDIRDVEIMKWKSHIQYRNVTKGEIAKWQDEFGASEAKKIAAKERKERTGKLIKKRIPGISHISDYDIIDAVAIGLWAVENGG